MARTVRPGATGGTGVPNTPQSAQTPGASEDLRDQYWLHLGVRSDDMQAGLRGMTDSLREASQEGVKQTSALAAGFTRVQKAASLLGVTLTPAAIVQGLLEAQGQVRALRGVMYEAGREATRGGGAMLEWTTLNRETYGTFLEVVEKARSSWRRDADEVANMFKVVSMSGIGMVEAVGASADKVMQAVTDVSRATELAFSLEFLGFAPEQITSLYRSMSVNLNMSVGEIEDAMYRFLLISQDTTLAWRDQIRVVVEAVAQYSRFGVNVDEVALLLNNLVAESKAVGNEFFSVGMAYDILMDKLNIRTQVTPTQWMMAMSQLTPADIATVITGVAPGDVGGLTESEAGARNASLARMSRWVGQLEQAGGVRAGLTMEDVLQGDVDLIDWPRIAAGFEQMQLTRMAPVLNRRMGEGRTIMGRDAAETALFWERMEGIFGAIAGGMWQAQVGQAPDPVEMMQRVAGVGDAELTNVAKGNEILAQLKVNGRDVPDSAKEYFATTSDAMTRVAESSTGIWDDTKYIVNTLFRRALPTQEGAAAREGWRNRLDDRERMQREEFLQRTIQNRLRRGIDARLGPSSQLNIPSLEGGTPEERRAAVQQLSGLYRTYFPEGYTEEAMMNFIQNREGPVSQGMRGDLIRYITGMSQLPAYQRLITPEMFPGIGQVQDYEKIKGNLQTKPTPKNDLQSSLPLDILNQMEGEAGTIGGAESPQLAVYVNIAGEQIAPIIGTMIDNRSAKVRPTDVLTEALPTEIVT